MNNLKEFLKAVKLQHLSVISGISTGIVFKAKTEGIKSLKISSLKKLQAGIAEIINELIELQKKINYEINNYENEKSKK